MSFDDEGIPLTWEEIKAASRKLDWLRNSEGREKQVAREYLTHTDCEDAPAGEHVAVPGYN